MKTCLSEATKQFYWGEAIARFTSGKGAMMNYIEMNLHKNSPGDFSLLFSSSTDQLRILT